MKLLERTAAYLWDPRDFGGCALHMLQRWMGHASMSTTAIYATALEEDQLEIADRMWA